MRIIDWKVLKTMQPYSRQHIARLEQRERDPFPRRVQLGVNRTGWYLHEVEVWLESRPRG